MSRFIQAISLVAAFSAPAMLHAQDTTHVRDTTSSQVQDARVLNHTFNAAIGEPVRVFLAKDVEYDVEIDGTSIQLQLRPRDLTVQLPRIEPLLGGMSATGGTSYRVTPHADAEYEFVSSGGDPARPVTLRVRALKSKVKG
jgi:hypothetical protein